MLCPSAMLNQPSSQDEKHAPDVLHLKLKDGVVVRYKPENFAQKRLPQRLLSDSRRVFPIDSSSSSNITLSFTTHPLSVSSLTNNSGAMVSSIQMSPVQVPNLISMISGPHSTIVTGSTGPQLLTT